MNGEPHGTWGPWGTQKSVWTLWVPTASPGIIFHFPLSLSLAVGKHVLGAPRPQPNKSELACRFPKKGSPGLFKAVNGAPHLGSIIPGPSFPLSFFTSFRGLLTSTNSIIIPPGLLSPPFRSTLSRPSSPPTQGSPIPISQLLGPSPFPLLSCLPAHFFQPFPF